ncbi:MAG TPA: extracellular solute-binding protein [Bacillota bacterium]|nr:extracellular solute-binding protein [Bacillota bacterium]
MKKILSLIVGALLVISLSACAEIRNTPPEIVGASTSVTIYVGDSYDPLAGITATDAQDGDLTSSITVEGYNAAWLTAQGVRTYILSVEDSEGSITQITVTLTILPVGSDNEAPILLGVFNTQTYYIGSTAYDPLRGVTATDAEDGDLTGSITYTTDYSTTRAGKYTITVDVEDSEGAVASETIILTVKAAVSIPTLADLQAAGPISISLWHSNGETIETALKAYADDFEVYMNTTYGLTVDVTINKAASNYDDLRQTIVSLINASGELPNIVQNYPDHVMEYISNRALISLTPYIDDSTWGYGDGDDAFEDILEIYRRENCQYTTDGEYYSIPFNKSTEVVIYNKTLFDDMIADGVIDSFPTTWQDLFALSDEIIARSGDMIDQIAAILNKSPNTSMHKTASEIADMKANFVPFSYDSSANAFITLLRQWGGEYTSIDTQREGVILFNNDQAEQMLSFVYENKDIFTVPAYWASDYASDLFVLGETAVTIGSTGGARYNTPDIVAYTEGTEEIEEQTFEVGITSMLYNEDHPEYATAIQQGTNMSITNEGTAEQQLVSWLFLKYLTSAEVQLNFALETGYSPVRSSVYTEEEYIQFTNGYVLNASNQYVAATGSDLVKALASKAAAAQSSILFYDQAFVGSSTARSAVEAAFERVVLSTETTKTELQIIQEALAAAEAEANRVLGN